VPPGAGACGSRSPTPDTPLSRSEALLRPRSPTPTKMLAWEEEQNGQGRRSSGSPGDSDHEGRGDQTDGFINKLIEACQMNDVSRAFSFFEKLRRMRVPLYEGVYKMIMEVCMRTQQLGLAIQFYETLKGSNQRISPRLVTVLIEACAREQHGDKVYAIWNDWCPASQPITASSGEVLLVVLSALIRTMSPDLAQEVFTDALKRPGESLVTMMGASVEVELEELLQLNETVADEAQMNGTLMGELAGQFSELHVLLEDVRQHCLQELAARPGGSPQLSRGAGGGYDPADEMLLMEDVDLDLELAAM